MNSAVPVSSTSEARQRKNLGVVYTPAAAASAITDYVLSKLESLPSSVLEPSVGDGSFLAALLSKRVAAATVTAIDIDPVATETLKFSHPEAEIICSDFLDYALSSGAGKFDLIIGNPPFIRSRFFSPDFADNVGKLAAQQAYARGELKNAWAAFVLAASSLLTCGGTLAFIVPYELLNVSYGKHLQSELFTKFRYLEILVPDEKAFVGIEQDAVVVIASNLDTLPERHCIKLVTSLEQPNSGYARDLKLDGTKNQSVELKSSLLDSHTSELLHKMRTASKTVSNFCTCRAGIVTAANDFFILSGEEVENLGLGPWARPILKKGSYLGSDLEYNQSQYAENAERHKCLLIDFVSDGQPPLSEAALDYIKFGEGLGFDKRFKMRSRDPWYKIPIVASSEALFFKRSHRLPRLVPNRAEILATDTAYIVTAKDGFDMQAIAFSFYNILTILFAEIDGRFYGGGVLELTPSEFRSLPLPYKQPTSKQYQALAAGFKTYEGNSEKLLKKGDGWLKASTGMSDDELKLLYDAYRKIQRHRLRHGATPNR
jgi:adenine-specific DNA-methyltransferase